MLRFINPILLLLLLLLLIIIIIIRAVCGSIRPLTQQTKSKTFSLGVFATVLRKGCCQGTKTPKDRQAGDLSAGSVPLPRAVARKLCMGYTFQLGTKRGMMQIRFVFAAPEPCVSGGTDACPPPRRWLWASHCQ